MNKKLQLAVLACFVAGIILGILCPGIFPHVSFLGDVYLRLLKAVMIPLLMAQVASGTYRAAGRFTGTMLRAVGLFVLMFTVTYLVTAAAVLLLRPGHGFVMESAEWSGELASATAAGFFKTVIPDNIFSSMASGSMLPCILFSFITGIAAAKCNAERFGKLLEECCGVFSKVLGYVMYLAPAGVFSLMGSALSTYGPSLMGTGVIYVAYAWGLCLLSLVLVMILPAFLFAGVSPLTYVRRCARIWTTSLSTCSSAATLPYTLQLCEQDFGIPGEITGIVVPLGCTIHMCGGAVSFCLLSLFTVQAAGIPLTAGLFLQMYLIALLMNMAAPGIPGGGIVLGATYLSMLGLPTGFIGFYSGIYRLLDMPYTTLNVTGDVTANLLIHRRAKTKSSAA